MVFERMAREEVIPLGIEFSPMHDYMVQRHGLLLSQLLPAAWTVELERGPARSGAGDYLLTLSAAGQPPLRTVVIASTAFTPRDVGGGLGTTASAGQAPGLPVPVVSLWFSQRTRTLLREAGLNFVDVGQKAHDAPGLEARQMPRV